MGQNVEGSQNRKSASSAQNQAQGHHQIPSQCLQSKKSTKEKYQELKALYNDLLERHYALAA